MIGDDREISQVNHFQTNLFQYKNRYIAAIAGEVVFKVVVAAQILGLGYWWKRFDELIQEMVMLIAAVIAVVAATFFFQLKKKKKKKIYFNPCGFFFFFGV